jgi:hypothetical protein
VKGKQTRIWQGIAVPYFSCLSLERLNKTTKTSDQLTSCVHVPVKMIAFAWKVRQKNCACAELLEACKHLSHFSTVTNRASILLIIVVNA